MRHHDQEHQRRTGARLRPACLAAVALASLTILAAGCSGGSSGTSAAGSSSSGSSAMSQALKYSECMRSHGIADFPDPNGKGQITVTVNGPGSDLVSTNQKFQAAEAACESLQPAGGTPAQQQQDYAAELKYAQCMQSHSVDVPDPRAPGAGPGSQRNSGSNSGTAGNGVDPNSPQYIAANNACQHYLPAGSGPSLAGGGS
jgi:hypothetical protein